MPLLLPSRCPGCDRPGRAPCPVCTDDLLALAIDQPGAPGVPGVIVAVPFVGVAHRLVTGLKYRGCSTVAPALAEVVARRLATSGRADVDLVTWAPTTPGHRRRRGADHAELVARALARRLRLPCRPLLRRHDDRHQTGQTRAARLIGPTLVGRRAARGRRILVVDDVVTTGATLRAAEAALRVAGAAAVVAVAVAATPQPGLEVVGSGHRPAPPRSRR